MMALRATWTTAIARERSRTDTMAIARERGGRQCDGGARRMGESIEASEGFGDAGDDLALDELFLTACGLAEGSRGEAVDLA